jgi:hypothetical protein
MSDTVAMKRAIKFVQKYMAKAELPLTEADLTHAFFEGKNFGLSRAWHRIMGSVLVIIFQFLNNAKRYTR